MKEKFIDHKFNTASLALIQTANGILNEYRSMGYRLSLRQLYYQLVARDYIENSIRSYKWIGNLISDARLAGLLDWGMIEDRGRETVIPTAWDSPAQIIRACADQFRIDRWEGQPCYVEVMVEKDALSGILEPVCRDLHVRFTANKGYSSSSAMYETGKRIHSASQCVDEIHIFYLGDHDPSGIDMTRDIAERLQMFTYGLVDAARVHRLALNWNQVEEWKPPENPAKETDSRYEAYVHEFGGSSWELDAVEPRTLADLVRNGITELIDQEQWGDVAAREEAMREELGGYAEQSERSESGEQDEEEEPQIEPVKMTKPEIRSHKNVRYDIAKSERGYSIYIRDLNSRWEWFEEKSEAMGEAKKQIEAWKATKKKSRKGKK